MVPFKGAGRSTPSAAGNWNVAVDGIDWRVTCTTYRSIFIEMWSFDPTERRRDAKFASAGMQGSVNNVLAENEIA
jgi:hypothetical protein